jgi:carboxymethylenebutenolidase
MGTMVEFPSNGTTGSGYFAPAEGGAGPGIIVIQEWWGLVPHIRDVVDRFAAAGFSALAPDLYRGATTTEPDEAGKLMMALNLGQAARDLRGAITFLRQDPAVSSTQVGVTGFCMGGGLALMLAAQEPQDVAACVPFYGLIPWEGAEPDWGRLDCSVLGHYAERDAFFPPDKVASLQGTLTSLGKDALLTVHPGVDHAYFNDDRPEVYDPTTAESCWEHTLEFFRDTVH